MSCLWRGLRDCYFQHKSSSDVLQLQIATSLTLYILANSVKVPLLTSIHSISVKVCVPVVARISRSRDNFDSWSGSGIVISSFRIGVHMQMSKEVEKILDLSLYGIT